MSRHGTYDPKCGFIPDDDCPQEMQMQTNTDCIISKSPEELAALLEGCICPIDPCPDIDRDTPTDKKHCTKCWLDWLRQEADR